MSMHLRPWGRAANKLGGVMNAREAMLAEEALASDCIEQLYVKWHAAAVESSLHVLILCLLMVEEIEQTISPSDRSAIRENGDCRQLPPNWRGRRTGLFGGSAMSTETAMLAR